MKFSIAKDQLLSELGVVGRGISARSAVQTLAGIQVQVHEGQAEFRATDMEIGIQTWVSAHIEREGTVVLPGRLLVDVVRSLPSGEVTLEYQVSDNAVAVLCGPASFRLRTLPAEDFPPLPETGDAEMVQVPVGVFVEAVTRVARAASRDETRPHLTGVLVSAGERSLRMVATDSYRLSVRESPLEEALEGAFEVNVPVRALQELTRIAGSTVAGMIGIASRDNQVVFQLGEVTVSSRLVEGRFPNFRQLLPESYEHELRLSSAELLEVVRRVSLLAQRNAPLRLRFSEGVLEVSAQTPEVGEARESLPVRFQGEPLEIGFNPEFLRDGLESVGSEELVLKLISPLRPGLIESGDDGFTYLVMPIRLNV